MGYVGLTLAVAMANAGFRVLGLETDAGKLEQLLNYKVHFHEDGLSMACKTAVERGRLKFAHPQTISDYSDYSCFIITVGTPLDDQGEPRMDMVDRCSRFVAQVMPDDSLVILRSTVKLGTTRSITLPALKDSGKTFGLAYCSERTLEGRALDELRTLPQVIGGLDRGSSARAEQVFLQMTESVIHTSSMEAAELIKLLDNSFRDYSFAFGNEVALICEAAGLNASEVIETANWKYERTNIPRPGFVGGPCLEKDPHILCSSLRPYGYTPRLIKLARYQNEYLPIHMVDRIQAWENRHEDANIRGIMIHGLAFKGWPATDDLRGSPVKLLIAELKKRWPYADIFGHDFLCTEEQIKELGIIPINVVNRKLWWADVTIIANNHQGYQDICWTRDEDSYRYRKVLVDCWGSVEHPEQLKELEIDYIRLGDNG